MVMKAVLRIIFKIKVILILKSAIGHVGRVDRLESPKSLDNIDSNASRLRSLAVTPMATLPQRVR